ncbi:PepSY-associated TM helix domain-containing protein [Olivibacter ginsenosidimutans]|uniref:PepSY-associated TM helix domain-containing protein n=1 Tax=Olivibacter ginsenosidimutans TaxID=1176537 RepID=A0ABP9AVV5_9SPHI
MVFIVGLTGCVLTFQKEIEDWMEPYRLIEEEHYRPLRPQYLLRPLLDSVDTINMMAINYLGTGRTAVALYETREGERYQAFIHPATGNIKHIKRQQISFFMVMLQLHVRLLIPGEIGQYIVSYATLIFMVLLLGGMILWWPKKWKGKMLKNSLWVNWKAKTKRLNYDLHNVYGFYAFLPALVIAFTGVFISVSWLNKSVYRIASKGQVLPERTMPHSTIVPGEMGLTGLEAVDSVWFLLGSHKHQASYALSFIVPQKPDDVVTVTDNPDPETARLAVIRHFDRYSFRPIPMPHYWQKEYESSNFGDLIGRYNFDIHVGRIGGMPGKFLAFMASLVCTSLPITGFFIWFNRRKGKRKRLF